MQLYHERPEHQNRRYVISAVKRELGLDLPHIKVASEGCIIGKAQLNSVRGLEQTNLEISYTDDLTPILIDTDICGPFQSKD